MENKCSTGVLVHEYKRERFSILSLSPLIPSELPLFSSLSVVKAEEEGFRTVLVLRMFPGTVPSPL